MVKTCQVKELGPPELPCLGAVSQQSFSWLWEILCLISVLKTQQLVFVLFQVKTTMNVISLQGRRRFTRCTQLGMDLYNGIVGYVWQVLIFTSSQGLINDPV